MITVLLCLKCHVLHNIFVFSAFILRRGISRKPLIGYHILQLFVMFSESCCNFKLIFNIIFSHADTQYAQTICSHFPDVSVS